MSSLKKDFQIRKVELNEDKQEIIVDYYPYTRSKNVTFLDGKTLQDKYDNGELGSSGTDTELKNHIKDTIVHTTSAEKTRWNAIEQNSKTYTDTKVADLVNGAPESLDTLKELADAMDQHNGAYETLLAEVGKKSDKGHKHTKSEITDFPTSFPANGGDADTVDGFHARDFLNVNTGGSVNGALTVNSVNRSGIGIQVRNGSIYTNKSLQLQNTEGAGVDVANIWFDTRCSKSMQFSNVTDISLDGKKVYHEGRKPNWSDISSKPNFDNEYLKLSGGTLGGALVVTANNQPSIKLISTNGYGHLQCGSSGNTAGTLKMTGLNGNPLGALDVSIANGTNFKVNGSMVYTASNKPTPAEIGAATASHGTHVSYGVSTSDLVQGTSGTTGTSASVSRADHTHFLPAYPTLASLGGLSLAGGTLTGSLTATQLVATGNSKTATIGTGSADVFIANSKSNKYLQLRDDGSLQYDAKRIVHSGERAILLTQPDGASVKTVLETVNGNESGIGVILGAGGLTVVGSGESGRTVVSEESITGGNESLYLTADSGIVFKTNCDMIANRLTTTLDNTGNFNMVGCIKSNKVTGTYLSGNQGNGLFNSTAAGGEYVTMLRYPSQNGYFTMGGYVNHFDLHYTAKSTVDAGENSVTKTLKLLDETGNSNFPGEVSSKKLIASNTGATPLIVERIGNSDNLNIGFNINGSMSYLGVPNGVLKFGTAENLGDNGYTIYHSGKKPTPAEIGAADTSHSHNYLGLGGGTMNTGAVIAWNTPGDGAKIYSESDNNITSLCLETADDGDQDAVKIRNRHWEGDLKDVATFGRDNVYINSTLHIQNGNGKLEAGSRNSGYFHFDTDRPAFHFYKRLSVQGNVELHDNGTNFIAKNDYGFTALDTAGHARYLIYLSKSNEVVLGYNAERHIKAFGHLVPYQNRSYWLGTNSPAQQWKGLCAEGGTVGASDARVKENIYRLDGTKVLCNAGGTLKEVKTGERFTKATSFDYYEFMKDRFKPAYYNYHLSKDVMAKAKADRQFDADLKRRAREEGYRPSPEVEIEDEYKLLKNIGFLAQDYDIKNDRVAQEFIFEGADGNLSYNHMSYVTVGMIALQEATKKIELLEKENEDLKRRIDKIEKKLFSS